MLVVAPILAAENRWTTTRSSRFSIAVALSLSDAVVVMSALEASRKCPAVHHDILDFSARVLVTYACNAPKWAD